jgi:geranylgeranyl diphosphate synthase type II
MLNQLKTGALFIAAAEAGARVAGAPESMLETVRRFALEFGLAFQIADDVLDDATHAGLTGKDTGKDSDKPTLVSVLGRDGARQLFESHVAQCRQCLSEMGCADNPLVEFVESCFARVRL